MNQITLTTWITIFLIVTSAIVFTFKLDKRIIFLLMRKDVKWRWVHNAYNRIRQEVIDKQLKYREKRKSFAIEQAKKQSAAFNGRRMYVIQVGNDYIIVDSRNGKQWLKQNHKDPNTILANEAVYYTPATNMCENNSVEKSAGWVKLMLMYFGIVKA